MDRGVAARLNGWLIKRETATTTNAVHTRQVARRRESKGAHRMKVGFNMGSATYWLTIIERPRGKQLAEQPEPGLPLGIGERWPSRNDRPTPCGKALAEAF